MYIYNIKYPINLEGRDFVIGDLHGCYDSFVDMLELIDFDKDNDRMFSVGDLIDRGTQNLECLRLIEEPWFHSVLGNHEQMMVNAVLEEHDYGLWVYNGGNWFARLTVIEKSELSDLCDLVKKLPLSMTIETADGEVGISHAEPPSKDWKDTKDPDYKQIQKMLWARTWITSDPETNRVKNIKESYHGHTPVKDPIIVGNCNFIDTGIVYDGRLTCIQIE